MQSAHAIKTEVFSKLFHAKMSFFDTTHTSMLYRKLNGVNPISNSALHSFTVTASSLVKLPLALVEIHSSIPTLLLPVDLATSSMALISHSTSLAKHHIYRSLVAVRSDSVLFFKQVAKQLQRLVNSKMNTRAHYKKPLLIHTCKTMSLQLCGQLFPEIHRNEKRDEKLFKRTYEIEQEVSSMAPFGSIRLQTAE
ncbi:uncharacterized protein MONOS_17046 [Monocercomonoides exilis]|uniref:uncharacterized protein n=1 Tax=Monocercomonoides exilis TaxID=2049356 RepID=UPI00355A10A7|nr:hypothetical protein MONOS_17046 [Monocercomonoides exilis]